MGGSAFLLTHPHLKVLRLSSASHSALSSLALSRLAPLFEKVAVPRSAPEKADHGDLDTFALQKGEEAVEAEDVGKALGAVEWIQSSPTSNFAVPPTVLSSPPVSAVEDEEAPTEVYQVDVHVCKSTVEWEMGMLMHEFGDCGMIMSRFVKGTHSDAVLSTYGLRMRTHITNHPYIVLSVSSSSILDFLGLDPASRRAGFYSLAALFAWLSASPYCLKRLFLDENERNTKERRRLAERTMYQAWLKYLEGVPDRQAGSAGSKMTTAELLEKFGKTEEYDRLLQVEQRRKDLKDLLKPSLLDDPLPRHGRGSKADGVRRGEAMQRLREAVDARYPTTIPSITEVDSLVRSLHL